MHEYLATTPFDLYTLSLFDLVVQTGSFTKAGQKAGLSQSAITRQVKGMEDRLGTVLFERTTRQVSLTRVGQRLHAESIPILRATRELVEHIQTDFELKPRSLTVGLAGSIGLAYLPGYFFAFHRKHPEVQIHLKQSTSKEIIQRVEAKELDVGLVSLPPRLPRPVQVTHKFRDEFCAIAPPRFPIQTGSKGVTLRGLKSAFKDQRWLLIDRERLTGRCLHKWLGAHDWRLEPAMELDSFDVIVGLVSLGFGVSLVPHRVLALYGRRRQVTRVAIRPRFSRELGVVVRKNRRLQEPLASFVDGILF